MTPEGAVVKAITDVLAVKQIMYWRMNTGAFSGEHAGKRRFVRFGSPGMADILASPIIENIPHFLWIEAKAPRGRQSVDQRIFQDCVEYCGHHYLIVRESQELFSWLKDRGL